MRRQRGVTVVELLVALAIGTTLILGIGSFYWRMIEASRINDAQIGMQRRASLIQAEFSRVIQGSDGILAGTCGPSDTAGLSVPVHVPADMLWETTTPHKGPQVLLLLFQRQPR